jgi:F-type H+-transporting ATPase subunit delta
MRGSSAESYARLDEQLTRLVDEGADATRLADDLFGAVGVFRTQPAFRRAATDPTAELEARTAMVRDLFGSHLEKAATELVGAAAGMRWASSLDMVDTLERLGVVAVARAADAAGEGDRLETEMFTFGQLIADHPELREALTDRTRSVADKQALLRSLLDGKATAGTVRLAEQAVTGSYTTVRQAFDDYGRFATEARGRVVARVTVAHPLAEEHRSRLAAVLQEQYGRPVHLDIVVDPDAIGGIQVEVGDELIDGTIATRLGDAGRRLAG